MVTSVEKSSFTVHSSRRTADDCKATWYELTLVGSSLVRSGGSTTSLVTDRRCQRKGTEEDERVSLRIVWPASTSNSFFEHRDRGTDADDAVQGKSSICHRGAAMECHGSNVSVKNKFIGPSTSVVFGSRRSATVRCCWMSGVIGTKEATHGDVHADGGVRDPPIRSTRIEARGGCLNRLLETSRVCRATAGSRVNLQVHACDAMWVMCHAAVTVVLDRECARRRRSPACTRKEPAGKQRAPTRGPVQTTRVTTRR